MSNYICPYCGSNKIEGIVKLWIDLNNESNVVRKDDYIICINNPFYCKDCNSAISYKEIHYSNNGDSNG